MATLFFHPDMIESDVTPLVGRRTVGASFIEGLVQHAALSELRCVADTKEHLIQFRDLVQGYGWRGSVRGTLSRQPWKLAQSDTLVLPGPSFSEQAWVRRRSDQRSYSLCGITHTVSTSRISKGLFELLAAPVESWDAIVCTSRTVQDVVASQFDAAEAYYKRRFHAERVTRPQLPIIPLGIHTDRFIPSEGNRRKWRQAYDIPPEAVVVLSVGRLSVYEKMHPAPLFLALQQAAESTSLPVILLMAGWFANEHAERQYRAAAEQFAPSVNVYFPDGRETEVREGIWSAADIFALPVDNIQETFGLAPVEAMAAGLPIVCSDWDGFKDTVEHGECGYRIRTLMSSPGMGQPLAEWLEQGNDSYLQFLGTIQQRIVVDVREMADAFANLINNPDRRRSMGQAGQMRARRLYDWSAIIPQYQALWSDLAERRAHEMPSSARHDCEPANPAAIDPFTLYRGYPTATLERSSVLQAFTGMNAGELDKLMQVTGATSLARVVAERETILQVLAEVVQSGPLSFGELLCKLDTSPQTIEGAVLWLTKFDFIQIAK